MDNGLVRKEHLEFAMLQWGLNPYCSGQWSRTHQYEHDKLGNPIVLILIVVDNGLVLAAVNASKTIAAVLILIVVDNGLVLLPS